MTEGPMETEREGVNIQNDFFNRARKSRARVALFLTSGKKLMGRIKAFDRFTVILEGSGGEQMIFKHAIATVTPARSFDNRMDLRRREAPPSPDGAPADGPSDD